MAVKPLMDRVIVKPLDVTEGTIFIPDGLQGRPGKGEVVATGPGHNDGGIWVDVTVKPGDIVLYPDKAGLEMMVGTEKCLIMREFEIYAIEQKDEPVESLGPASHIECPIHGMQLITTVGEREICSVCFEEKEVNSE
jgi:chaperonin GroES